MDMGELYNQRYQDWNDYVVTTYSINQKRNGIELTYAHVPSDSIRARLKCHGWKWSSYSKVWYTHYSEEALLFAKSECSLTETRRKLIKRIPVFYRNHCGYSDEQLLHLSKSRFDDVAKYGTLAAIAKELLFETLPDASLSYLTEIYLRIMRDEKYRNKFINKIPRSCYTKTSSGKYIIRDNLQKTTHSESVVTDSLFAQLELKQSRFWNTLEIFGGELKPIDRTAFEVSNYRKAYVKSSNKAYMQPSSRKEYHLFIILASLTLDYDDFLTRTIKEELEKELEAAMLPNSEDKNFYLLAIYSHIVGNRELTNSLLDKLIEKETAKSIITKKESLFSKYAPENQTASQAQQDAADLDKKQRLMLPMLPSNSKENYGAIKSFRYSLWMHNYQNYNQRKDPSVDIQLTQGSDNTISVFANFGGKAALYRGDISDYICKGNLNKIIRPILFRKDYYAQDDLEISGLDIRNWETYSFDNEWFLKQCIAEEQPKHCTTTEYFSLEIVFDNSKRICAQGYRNNCCDNMIDALFRNYDMMRVFSAWNVSSSDYASLLLPYPNDILEERWYKAQQNPYECISASHYGPVAELDDDIW